MNLHRGSRLPTTAHDFATVLRHLTALQELKLDAGATSQIASGRAQLLLPDTPDGPVNMQAVHQAAAQLPNLVNLSVLASGQNVEAVAPLAQSTQLARLHIVAEENDDAACMLLAHNPIRLKELGLECCSVTDESLVAIVQTLRQLTVLWLRDCIAMKDAGAEQLFALQHLQALNFCLWHGMSHEVGFNVLKHAQHNKRHMCGAVFHGYR